MYKEKLPLSKKIFPTLNTEANDPKAHIMKIHFGICFSWGPQGSSCIVASSLRALIITKVVTGCCELFSILQNS